MRASRELRAIPGVRNFGSHIGRAEVADEVVGPNFTELWISLDPAVDYDATVAKVQEAVDGYPGLTRDLLTYLKERIKEVLSGSGASIVVRLYGPDLDTLRSKAQEIGEAMKGVEGVIDLKVEPQVLVPQIEIRFRPEAADRFGLTPGDVRRAATTLIKGAKVGELYDEQKIFDVVVWGVPRLRTDPESLRRMLIDTPGRRQGPALRGRRGADRVDAQHHPARERVEAHRRDRATCAGATSGAWRGRSSSGSRACPSRPATTRSSWASTRRGRRPGTG